RIELAIETGLVHALGGAPAPLEEVLLGVAVGLDRDQDIDHAAIGVDRNPRGGADLRLEDEEVVESELRLELLTGELVGIEESLNVIDSGLKARPLNRGHRHCADLTPHTPDKRIGLSDCSLEAHSCRSRKGLQTCSRSRSSACGARPRPGTDPDKGSSTSTKRCSSPGVEPRSAVSAARAARARAASGCAAPPTSRATRASAGSRPLSHQIWRKRSAARRVPATKPSARRAASRTPVSAEAPIQIGGPSRCKGFGNTSGPTS